MARIVTTMPVVECSCGELHEVVCDNTSGGHWSVSVYFCQKGEERRTVTGERTRQVTLGLVSEKGLPR